MVVEIPLSLGQPSCSEENEIPKFQNLQSIHLIFPFLEDKFWEAYAPPHRNCLPETVLWPAGLTQG
ncbi:hypothetical protein GQ55_1G281400 [Panicum hallii var. hallii]|uniref:Maturase MatK N-terminal domain-containing protein n=1 Tax=Panicum hallii var. hallii TaxID=1504633 RepID=A0A2T7F8D8_9POAL|nr:hypothetical protein GQ55_1G281400 [Panicum hallii var. hallii]